jgi:hypothetical protein
MSELFNRTLKVNVTNRLSNMTVTYEGLHIKFRFTRTGTIEKPDTAMVVINNIDLSFYNSIEKAENLYIEVFGGYNDSTGLLFSGVAKKYTFGRVDNTSEIKIELGDSIEDVVFRESFTKQTDYVDMFKKMISGLGDQLVELPAQIVDTVKKLVNDVKDKKGIGVTKNVKTGKTISGLTINKKLNKALSELLNPQGLVADIVNNEFIVRRMFAESETKMELAPHSGLLEVKRTKVKLKNAKNQDIELDGIEFETLLMPELFPGKTVLINSKSLSGEYITGEQFTITECVGNGGNFPEDQFTMTLVAHEQVS